MRPARARFAYAAAGCAAGTGLALVAFGLSLVRSSGNEDEFFVHLVGWVAAGVGLVELGIAGLLAAYAAGRVTRAGAVPVVVAQWLATLATGALWPVLVLSVPGVVLATLALTGRSADPAALGEGHDEHDHQRRRGGEHDPV